MRESNGENSGIDYILCTPARQAKSIGEWLPVQSIREKSLARRLGANASRWG